MTDPYRTPTQSETRDGVTMTAYRYAEKRNVTKEIPAPDGAPAQYVAERTDVFQLEIRIEGGSALVEPGALQYMHGKIASEVIRHEPSKGLLGRTIASAGTGESAYATKFTGLGTVWCEPGNRHLIIGTMDGDDDALLLDDRAFYACSAGIQLTTHVHKTVSGAFSGNGLMQPKLSGMGVFAAESPVPVDEIEVLEVKPGEEVVVDGDYMLMYSASLDVAIGPLVKGLRNAARSGEGFVYRFSGRGQVWVMPTARLA